MNPARKSVRSATSLTLLASLGVLGGCHVDSFFNPSVTGYWEAQPTTIPILERIDVIEKSDDAWGQTTAVTPEDLIPSDLAYKISPGDIVTVQIFELYATGEWSGATRRIDAGGLLRVPELGDIPAAGRTAQEIEDDIETILRGDLIARPQVQVVVEQGGAFNYTVYGLVAGPGLYQLQNPDLRLLDALAIAGGIPNGVENVYVIRQVELSDEVIPRYRQRGSGDASSPTRPADDPPVDIEDLIDQLEDPASQPDFNPGVLRQDGEPIIDIEDLQPVRSTAQPSVDIDQLQRQQPPGATGSWVYVEERGEWVRVAGADDAAGTATAEEVPFYVERIIEVPVDGLNRGQSKFNIVVRPKDRIYVQPPPVGVVYIDGQINRPGTFNLPPSGITLSRLVAAAGGLGQLAIPERVDLIRRVSVNREAAISVNLGAIRHRTEPDILLKPDDHVIIGTNWAATPLAIMRNGFRATYGFGFLLDRNFGNDVFGAPPVNRDFQ